MSSNEKFWMYDVTQLFRSYELLPGPDDKLASKLNTIMRLALIICVIIAVYKPFLAISTLVIVMVVNMSVYSGAVADPTIEGFEQYDPYSLTVSHEARNPAFNCEPNQQLFEFMREYNSTRHPDLNKVGFPTTQKRFCNDAAPLEYGPDHISPNQELVGGPNPKTRIPPLVAAPSHDLDSWRNNDFAVYSQINKETNFDADKSGYNCGILPTKCEECMYVPCQCKVKDMQTRRETDDVNFAHPVIEGFTESRSHSRVNAHIGARSLTGGGRHAGTRGHTRTLSDSRRASSKNLITNNPAHRKQFIRNLINELGVSDKKHKKPFIKKYVRDVFLDRRLGDVDEFEIEEIIDELTARFAMTPRQDENEDELQIAPCFESPRRDNIITQTLQPGVFQKSHIGEPIQSNIGISYTQEWGPTEVQETDNMIKYTMRDPKNTIITPQIKEEHIDQDNANVYDPRFTGYGTSYRSYTDQLTGRPKFFYDDIDAITMPNYITRSKVDMFPWANTYGPDKMMSASDGNEYRQLANNAFTDSALAFRTELQERLMRKRNAELWQRRVAPISTMGRLGSSMKSCL